MLFFGFIFVSGFLQIMILGSPVSESSGELTKNAHSRLTQDLMLQSFEPGDLHSSQAPQVHLKHSKFMNCWTEKELKAQASFYLIPKSRRKN